jgi:hypothetical protein
MRPLYHSEAMLAEAVLVLVEDVIAVTASISIALSGDFFAPPYLFKGPRPVIASAFPIDIWANLTVETPDAVRKWCSLLVRLASVTHYRHEFSVSYLNLRSERVGNVIGCYGSTERKCHPRAHMLLPLIPMGAFVASIVRL